MTIHIVLVAPKMPSNTGNIIRLCANSGAQLHLVRPLGFELDDKKLRRAGLDYHEYAHLQVHDDWAMTKQALQAAGCEIITALTTKLSKPFYDYDFSGQTTQHLDSSASNSPSSNHVALVFGSETAGLPEDIRTDIGADNWLRLPMLADSRSLNLSNSVAICLYEVWRQQGFDGDEGRSIGYDTLTVYDPK
ncbi:MULTISPECIES: tRNA (cytidine(34)-2'-O)-methyltransferase [Psychrobacter]|uniref:tRNA (cytidine(34)-2'-O)-methyltransferase n=1 Tax=Psychrobacter TaxID=497 RepID=UPI00118704C4|nr:MULTISPECIES: tRNA (cytidine(34)-2'-O)-methyltransferase [Psychrobacter]MBP7956201.1 tRNA (cytidine(34)-2'-O)-methyltransferase [Psychrobacter sp.]MBK3392883.1 tRNA (cytidine(34)-2'-O)-methyltransferase [Psychrobacter sp. M9-54-1]MBP8817260.1 tRNA (cytidine(34)-2'-O)-methyltransferase [Psychrobacter sp.]MBP9647181.1 tRNA (cytidine(34)-2'-O)-methyltransferase [Psychrobacter sp.]MDN5693461.1 tRNA (cytidine(34)-2'-O)-methyltransferase [Psychrobacter sp.]